MAVEQYYQWYVDQMEKGADPLGDHVYRKDKRIAPELVAWFDAFLKHDREYDPILQAQDDPNRVTVDRSQVRVTGDNAVVPVQLWYDDTKPHVVQVHAIRIGGVWKLRLIEESE